MLVKQHVFTRFLMRNLNAKAIERANEGGFQGLLGIKVSTSGAAALQQPLKSSI